LLEREHRHKVKIGKNAEIPGAIPYFYHLNKQIMRKILLLLACAGTLQSNFAQLVLTAESNDTLFIYSLAGPGIVVDNISRNCHMDGSGFFNATDANVGIENGIMLTSGYLSNAAGPNNNGSATGFNGYAGDPDLEVLTDWSTYDACIIEFDMTVMADTLKLQYVFGSEEYPEYVMSSFNDVFAFWVSGPDIVDPVNIAVVPGTGDPVSINSINTIYNPDFYVENGDGFAEPFASDSTYVQYDGITTVMLATIPVTAGLTYHMKMSIADAGDGILDSGVFLETGSLGSLRMTMEALADNGLSYAVEKCANGYFKLTNEVPCAEPLIIDYMIAGSATNGVDYETITEQLIIPAWDSIGYINIVPIHDAVDESFESVVLYLFNPQSGFIYDTLTMLIDDEPAPAGFVTDITDLTVSFTETSGTAVTVEWDFGDGTTSTEMNPAHEYAEDGNYLVCVSITNAYGCSDEYCNEVAVGAVDIMDISANIQLSPNPAKDILNVSGITADTDISILSLNGSSLAGYRSTGTSMQLDISNLPAGIYLIRIVHAAGVGVVSFEKQ